MNLEFGKFYHITKKYNKTHNVTDDDNVHTKWQMQPIETKKALFIGYRTIYNQVNSWGTETGYDGFPDDTRINTQRRAIKAALFVINKNTNPVYVPLDAINEAE